MKKSTQRGIYTLAALTGIAAFYLRYRTEISGAIDSLVSQLLGGGGASAPASTKSLLASLTKGGGSVAPSAAAPSAAATSAAAESMATAAAATGIRTVIQGPSQYAGTYDLAGFAKLMQAAEAAILGVGTVGLEAILSGIPSDLALKNAERVVVVGGLEAGLQLTATRGTSQLTGW